MEEQLTIRFRVGSVMNNRAVAVYLDNSQVYRKKRPVMAPGEMEQVVLPRDLFREHGDAKRIRILTEEA